MSANALKFGVFMAGHFSRLDGGNFLREGQLVPFSPLVSLHRWYFLELGSTALTGSAKMVGAAEQQIDGRNGMLVEGC